MFPSHLVRDTLSPIVERAIKPAGAVAIRSNCLPAGGKEMEERLEAEIAYGETNNQTTPEVLDRDERLGGTLAGKCHDNGDACHH